MIIPSVVLLILATVGTGLVIRAVFKKLYLALKLMGEYCGFIKRNDLELEIPRYQGTRDVRELFD